ncbi:Gfo/Idh/MocA family oxidoreductase [Shimia sp. R9_3]|uniref:Gfo/Idh/MocA family protein n=1 Tax=Shimia sp. R9_3 TaxID=2821113 RepID=UPI001ADC2021|nr:Gfo/Idh/MocA family oxidoreductase [Shimia sp. R9_3]
MSDPFKIAVVGVGLVGRRHVDAIQSLQNVSLTAVVDQTPEGETYAAKIGAPYFSDLSQMLQTVSPNGVILATPTPLHIEQGLTCVAYGCPLLVEKPIAVDAASALKLVHAAEVSDVPLLVGHHRRHNPLIAAAKQAIDANKIGEIRGIQGSCWFYKPDGYFDVAPWRKKKGAGPISVNLVHDIDLMRYLAGEIIQVHAYAQPSLRGFDNEDVAAAVMTFQNGAIATISVSDSIVSPWSWELTSGEYPIYPTTQESSYLIGGSHGSISIPDLRLWSHEEGQRDWWTPISATSLMTAASDPLVNQIAHFVKVARKEASPLVSGWEGLKTLQVIEAIQKSCTSGVSVTIAEPTSMQSEIALAPKISDISQKILQK